MGNTFRTDPTRTSSLRGRTVSRVNNRYRQIKGLINESFIKNRVLSNVEPLKKSDFAFLDDEQKIREFERWLEGVILETILIKSSLTGSELLTHWFLENISISYSNGARRAAQILRSTGVDISDPNIFRSRAHLDRLNAILQRNFSQLKGVTDVMAQQMTRVLADGIINGENPNIIAKKINDRVDKVGAVRSRLIARTEIVRAHNLGNIFEAELIESQIDEDVFMLWDDSDDDRVRPEHVFRDGKIYTRKKAMSLIGEPNCRCALIPILKSALKGRKVIKT